MVQVLIHYRISIRFVMSMRCVTSGWPDSTGERKESLTSMTVSGAFPTHQSIPALQGSSDGSVLVHGTETTPSGKMPISDILTRPCGDRIPPHRLQQVVARSPMARRFRTFRLVQSSDDYSG